MLYIWLIIVFFAYIFWNFIKISKYWEERNVVHEPAWPVLGNMGSVACRKKHFMDLTIQLYKKHKSERYVGISIFTIPMLMLRDLDLIREVTIRNFDNFHDHFNLSKAINDQLMSKSLVILNGKEWRQMRNTLSPVFTSSKMKIIYNLISECAKQFIDHLIDKEEIDVEMQELVTRFSTDVIATTAFGVKIDSLKDSQNRFYTLGSRLNLGISELIKVAIAIMFPFFLKITGAEIFPKEATDFFRRFVKDNIINREKYNIVRPDLIHLLMEARKDRLKPDAVSKSCKGFAAVEKYNIDGTVTKIKLTDDEIAAQAMIFFFSSFDTNSKGTCFLAHELATNFDIQKKLQNEIDEVNQKYKGIISYEVLISMKYFDQVITELFRLWPVGYQTDRLCTKDYIIEARNSNERNLLLKKGTSILIPIIAIHRDPLYYPEPEQFDPDRFSEDNKSKIVIGSYLPFGTGPRNCIGSRFAILEMKTFFFQLLSKFDIVPIQDTQIPLKINPKHFSLEPHNGFRLGLRLRNNIIS